MFTWNYPVIHILRRYGSVLFAFELPENHKYRKKPYYKPYFSFDMNEVIPKLTKEKDEMGKSEHIRWKIGINCIVNISL